MIAQVASKSLGIPASKIKVEIGDSQLPDAPTQGGSSITSSVGSAVHEVCNSLKQKLYDLACAKEGSPYKNVKQEEVIFDSETVSLQGGQSKIAYVDLLKQSNLPALEVTQESKGAQDWKSYSFYSFSVHFAQVRVHPSTGVVRVTRVVSGADAGTIISEKTARSQMIGGVTGGIGMALTEEGVIDHRFGRYVNNNLADYHVPVHADVPHIETFFVNKPDPHINPIGAKGMGEIALIGFSAAVANAVYHATGKRIRELPITPDKLI
jgi:xanthine dehydrogenase YagR molybdenum-binding subunit